MYYHEDTNTWPYDPSQRQQSAGGEYGARFIQAFFAEYAPAIADHWHFKLLREKSYGLSSEAFDEIANTADMYLNVSGVCELPAKLNPKAKRVFLDSDPGYNQMGLQDELDTLGAGGKRYAEVMQHDVHLTYAENIYADDCKLPRAGIRWIGTRPIVTMPHWEGLLDQQLPPGAPMTTVMTLDLSKKPKRLHYKGVDYFDKKPEFEKFISLPKRVPGTHLMLAIGNNNGLEPVLENGWHVRDSHDVSLTPAAYRQFIGDSAGEWSIAKNVYAATNSGWFSCRTCCYLAAGRPAVVQDTKWSRFVPSGAGVFAFDTMEECVAAIETIASDPAKQRRAAIDVARNYLAPDRVLPRMLSDIYG